MKSSLLVFLALLPVLVFSQSKDFSFGATLREVSMAGYPADTSASAVVLNEYGNAFIQETSGNLRFEYHVRIKILKQDGAQKANVQIPVRRGQSVDGNETVREVRASAFNLENGSLKETKLDSKNIFTQDVGPGWNIQKFAIPNARAGSVVEYSYALESPYLRKFRSWEFQSDIPKQKSTYNTSIPGNYQYNVTLKGFLKLTSHDQKLTRDCFRMNGGSADCAESKYELLNVPAFIEEDYMSAKENYLSALNFELSEVKHFDGRVVRYTSEWKDTDQEMKNDEQFGLQLRRGGNNLEDEVERVIAGVTDPLAKAKKVYDLVKFHYQWNELNGKYSESIKRAFESKKGSTADINLTLIAALREAGLKVDPIILSTRANGLPIEIHPVLTDFNYVIARLAIGENIYLLDATEDLYPFGTLPVRCLNGKGRVMDTDGESYWLPLNAKEKDRRVSMMNLVWDKDGTLKGKVTNMYFGYGAIRKRSEIMSEGKEKYVNGLRTALSAEINAHKIKNLDSIDFPLSESFEIDIQSFDGLAPNLLFNPFIMWKTKENPFKSTERLYPVDFGVPLEENITIALEFPPDYELTNLPEKIALTLPGNGGRYMYGATLTGSKVTINNLMTISRTIYTPQEYHYLKELYSRLLQVQSVDLVFRKK